MPRVQPSLPRGRRCRWPSGPTPPASETRAGRRPRIASRCVARRRYRSAGSWPMTACRLAVGSPADPPRCTARSAIGGGGGTGGDPACVLCCERRCRGGGENGRMGLTRREPRRRRRKAMTSGSKMRPGERPVTRTTGTVGFHVGSRQRDDQSPKHTMKNAWRQPGVRNSASSQTVPTERKKITPAESVNLVTTNHTPPGSHELAVRAGTSFDGVGVQTHRLRGGLRRHCRRCVAPLDISHPA